jgi:hypothetical protein
MPYRLSKNKLCVEVQRESGWEQLKCYQQKEKALAYLKALEVNVKKSNRLIETLQAMKGTDCILMK